MRMLERGEAAAPPPHFKREFPEIKNSVALKIELNAKPPTAGGVRAHIDPINYVQSFIGLLKTLGGCREGAEM